LHTDHHQRCRSKKSKANFYPIKLSVCLFVSRSVRLSVICIFVCFSVCLVLPCLALPCLALHCRVCLSVGRSVGRSCLVLSCLVLSCLALPCLALFVCRSVLSCLVCLLLATCLSASQSLYLISLLLIRPLSVV
jgi:hypothetical protein